MTFRKCPLALLGIVLSGTAAEPIRLHPKNPHYFLYRGKTIALITSGEHYGAVINADFDFHRYLATLSADGLNYTRLFGGSYCEVPAQSFGIKRNTLAPAPGRFIAPWVRSDRAGYQGGGNKFDLDRPNPEYLARLRDFLSEASRRGIVVEISLFSSHYQEMQWKVSPLNPANNVNGTDSINWKKLHTLENGNILERQERYVRMLVRETNPFDNVIFEIQNEPWSDRPLLASVVNPYLQLPARDTYPNSIDVADDLSVAWQTRVVEWITSEERPMPNHHLLAQNYSNFLFPVRHVVPGVSIVNFHYAYPDAVLLNYGIGKAISYDETGFLGRDDAVYRRQAWNFMLSGGSIFDALDYSFSVGHEDGSDTDPNGPGGGSPAFRQQLRILSKFLDALPLEDLAPDTRTVKHAAGVRVRAVSNTGGTHAMYFDGKGPADVTLDLPEGEFSGEWIDVANGTVLRQEHFQHRGGETILHSPDFREGIALRITRSNKGASR